MLSIIVPICKRYEQFIDECLFSIKNQKYQEFECLLIVDEKISQLDKFLNDQRFKIIESSKLEQSGKRNVGIQNAIGEKIIFIDCDDCIDANFLTICNSIKSDLGIFGITRDSDLFKNSERIFKETNLHFKKNQLFYDLYFKNENPFQNIILDSCCSKVFKAKILKENSIKFNEKTNCAEDCLFIRDYIKFAKSISYFDNYIAYYWRKNAISTTNTLSGFYNPNFFYAHLNEHLMSINYTHFNLFNSYMFNLIQLRISKIVDMLNNNKIGRKNTYKFLIENYGKKANVFDVIKTNKYICFF